MKNNILVTKSHRSGTTWTGKVIAKANKVRYVHEPFNIGMSRKNSPLTFWFEHLVDSSIGHQEEMKKYIDSFYKAPYINNVKKLGKVRSLKGLYFV